MFYIVMIFINNYKLFHGQSNVVMSGVPKLCHHVEFAQNLRTPDTHKNW